MFTLHRNLHKRFNQQYNKSKLKINLLSFVKSINCMAIDGRHRYIQERIYNLDLMHGFNSVMDCKTNILNSFSVQTSIFIFKYQKTLLKILHCMELLFFNKNIIIYFSLYGTLFSEISYQSTDIRGFLS